MEGGKLQLCRHMALSQSQPAHPLGERPIHFRAVHANTVPFLCITIPLPLKGATSRRQIYGKRFLKLANTKKIEDKAERKKVKRASRKKAAPKAKRTTPRGSNKKKVKKLVRGQSKR
jgi:hypothetical protein